MRNTTDDAMIAGCFVSGYWAISSGVSDEAIITFCKRSLAGEDKDKGSVPINGLLHRGDRRSSESRKYSWWGGVELRKASNHPSRTLSPTECNDQDDCLSYLQLDVIS